MFKTPIMTADEIFDKAMTTMSPLPSQESCARDLAAIFSYHLVKNELMDGGFGVDELPQQHAIMVAPTGTGKTYLLRHIAKACGVNMIFMDGSSMSRDGWKGASFGQHLLAARKAVKDNRKFERSVIFVDEVDKMRLWGCYYDAANVMDNLLQLFNGGSVVVEDEGKNAVSFDASRFTVIMGGAFAGLEDIIRKRMAPEATIGFGAVSTHSGADDKSILQHATPEDLEAYGMKKELIGRIGSIVSINPLGVEDYRRLLTAEVGSVQANYRNYFSFGYGVGFDIADAAVERIAAQCADATTGARAVMPIVNSVLREAITLVGRDSGINKVILSANQEGCFLQYEHGRRDVASVGSDKKETYPSYRVAGQSVMDICDTLCDAYLLTGCDREFTEEFVRFTHMTLVYLFDRCRPTERNLDSLRKLAEVTNKSPEADMAPYDIIISDYLELPDHNADMDKWFDEFRQTRTPDTARRLCRALTLIQRHLFRQHNSEQITFSIIQPQPTN